MMKSSKREYFFSAIVCALFAFASVTSCVKPEGTDNRVGSSTGGTSVKKEGKLVVGFAQMENNNPWRIAETTASKKKRPSAGTR